MFPRNRLFIRLFRYLCFLVTIVFLLEYFGLFTHFFEEKFNEKHFSYPYEGNIGSLCYQIRRGNVPLVEPINNQTYTYRNNNPNKCKDELKNGLNPHLLIVVKSKNSHFSRRTAIRNSWGYEKRFSDVIIRTIFTLGIDEETHNNERPSEIQKLVDLEAEKYQDIVQFNFIDAYFNNTIKTINGMRWAKESCIRSKFFLFVDDDYYVSVKNILAFLRNPINYPEYLEEYKEQLRKINQRKLQHTTTNGSSRQILSMSLNMELPPDVKLFAGFVFNSAPHRHKSSKWYVSLDEYKFDKWPTYVTAGSFVLSREALQEMYCTSLYTKLFR